MPELTPEEHEATRACIRQFQEACEAFQKLPREEHNRIRNEKHAEFLKKMGWGNGIIHRRCPHCSPKYGTHTFAA